MNWKGQWLPTKNSGVYALGIRRGKVELIVKEILLKRNF